VVRKPSAVANGRLYRATTGQGGAFLPLLLVAAQTVLGVAQAPVLILARIALSAWTGTKRVAVAINVTGCTLPAGHEDGR
jgi:hypothetical protein